jgi:uncharacterized protein YegJ (DUF2314 family)
MADFESAGTVYQSEQTKENFRRELASLGKKIVAKREERDRKFNSLAKVNDTISYDQFWEKDIAEKRQKLESEIKALDDEIETMLADEASMEESLEAFGGDLYL